MHYSNQRKLKGEKEKVCIECTIVDNLVLYINIYIGNYNYFIYLFLFVVLFQELSQLFSAGFQNVCT